MAQLEAAVAKLQRSGGAQRQADHADSALSSEAEAAAKELRLDNARLKERLRDATRALEQQRSGDGGKPQQLREQQQQQLREQLDAARREVRRLQDNRSESGGGGRGEGGGEVVALKEENTKLREELSAFDLDFFEEIEDLKYKYAEAVRKLQQYE